MESLSVGEKLPTMHKQCEGKQWVWNSRMGTTGIGRTVGRRIFVEMVGDGPAWEMGGGRRGRWRFNDRRPICQDLWLRLRPMNECGRHLWSWRTVPGSDYMGEKERGLAGKGLGPIYVKFIILIQF